jgi:hypothetical protein
LMKTQADVAGDIATAMEKNMASQARARNPKGEIQVAGVKSTIRTIQSVNTAVVRGHVQSTKDIMNLRKTVLDSQKAERAEQVRLRQMLERHYRSQREIRRQQIKADADIRRAAQHTAAQPHLIDRRMHAGYYAYHAPQGASGGNGGSGLFDLLAWQIGKKVFKMVRRSFSKLIEGAEKEGEAIVKEAEEIGGKIGKYAEEAEAKASEVIKGAEKTVERIAKSFEEAEKATEATLKTGSKLLKAGKLFGKAIPVAGELLTIWDLGKEALSVRGAGEGESELTRRQNLAKDPDYYKPGHKGFVVKNQENLSDWFWKDANTVNNVDKKDTPPAEAKKPEAAPPATVAPTVSADAQATGGVAGTAMVNSIESFATDSARDIGNITMRTMEAIDEKFHELLGWQKQQQNWVKPAKPAAKDDFLAQSKRLAGGGTSAPTPLPSDNTPTPTPAPTQTDSSPKVGKQGPGHVRISEWKGGQVGTGQPGTLSKPAMQAAISNMHANPLAGLQTTLPNPLQDFGPTSKKEAPSMQAGGFVPSKQNGYLSIPAHGFDGQAFQGFDINKPSTYPGNITANDSAFGGLPLRGNVNFSKPNESTFGDMKSVFFGPTRETHKNNPYIFVPPELQGLNPAMQPPVGVNMPQQAAVPYGAMSPIAPSSAMPLSADMFTSYSQGNVPEPPTPPAPAKVSPTDDLPGIQKAQPDKQVDPAYPNIGQIPQNTTDHGLHTLQTADDV